MNTAKMNKKTTSARPCPNFLLVNRHTSVTKKGRQSSKEDAMGFTVCSSQAISPPNCTTDLTETARAACPHHVSRVFTTSQHASSPPCLLPSPPTAIVFQNRLLLASLVVVALLNTSSLVNLYLLSNALLARLLLSRALLWFSAVSKRQRKSSTPAPRVQELLPLPLRPGVSSCLIQSRTTIVTLERSSSRMVSRRASLTLPPSMDISARLRKMVRYLERVTRRGSLRVEASFRVTFRPCSEDIGVIGNS